jgi:hypothetical protein
MWSIYIAGEYNAMPVVLADLYALTGDEKHLETAKCFINTALYQATVAHTDALNGKHANQHIPQFQGYLQIYEQTEEPDFYTAAANFWDMVVNHRTYTDGGMAGSGEIFGARDVIASTIGGNNAETCPAYNMLKLSRSLFFHTGDPQYMQYYERALYGQILASRRNTDSGTNPLLTYFVPMAPGSARSYGNLGTCCGGTGLESHTKFQDSIYFRSVDENTLYVNLYMPSTLSWPEKGLTVEQTTDYPTDPAGTVLLKLTGHGRLDLKLRVPYWADKRFSVTLNGEAQDLDARPGGYVTLSRNWSSGDTIAVAAPFSLRVEKTLDQPRLTQALAYGPVPMVALSDETTYRDFTLDADLTDSVAATGDPMTFTTNGLTLRPFYIDDTTRYHAYFHRVNRAPAVAGAQSVDEGQPLSFPVGTDPDGDDCVHTADGLPDGAHLDAAGGRLTWTPSYRQAGTYTLSVRVDDGLAATAGDVTITVNEVTVADQVSALRAYVAGAGLDDSARSSLSALLDRVVASPAVVDAQFVPTVKSLQAAGRLTDAQATELLTRAAQIDANVRDNAPPPVTQPSPPQTPPAAPPAAPEPTKPLAPAASAPTLRGTQHGATVRGSLPVARAHSRLEVELVAAKAALGRRGKGHVTVGRLVKRSVGGKRVEFAVALDAAAKRALRKRGRLAVTVRITVTPASGRRYTATRRVTLHAS